MIQITKEESMALRNKFGNDVCIAITNRHKRGGRKRYYTEETSRVRYFIDRILIFYLYPQYDHYQSELK